MRLDPKVKLMIELISRIRRQSITGVVEAAIEEIAFDLDAPFVSGGEAHPMSLLSAVSEIWSTDESERFIQLCHYLPSLITYEEQRLWETIKASKFFLTPGTGITLNIGRCRAWGESIDRIFGTGGRNC